ncbi:MAG: acylphosphatase [Archangium gephyra]|uniref:acylphosphatase n=1 Tax=Archangium gephyra TaxID=48 RepID=A0A2W5THA3_9BACT|nr:MAG: acylphosphatase [Archangium gephyra]
MALRRVHLRIIGLVQGVSYRASTRDEAMRLGVKGWVRNLPSGEVEVVAEGSSELLERFVTWCNRGPDAAHVKDVQVTEQPVDTPFTTFEVRR